jgi:hypothetical protein
MAPKPHEGRGTKDMMRDAEAALREGERVRSFADDVMRRRPCWPDDGNNSRGDSASWAEGVNSDRHS